MSAAEEARAAAYREQLLRRAQFRDALAAQLAGDSSAAASVAARWQPLTRERPVTVEFPARSDPPTNAD